MRLRTRLVLLVAAAALGPLVLLGLGATRVASRQIEDAITEMQGRTADGLALYVDTWMSLQLRLIEQQGRAFRLGGLGDDALFGFLRLVYAQVPEAQIVSLMDRAGVDRVPSVMRTPEEGGGDGRPAVSREHFVRFRERVAAAVASAETGQARAGTPYLAPDGSPAVPVVLASPDGAPLVLAAELGLGPLGQELARQGDGERDVVLLDRAGNALISGAAGLVDGRVFRPFGGGVRAVDVRYRTEAGVDVLAACAPVPSAGWMVVVAEPLERATAAAVSEITLRTAYIAAVVSVLALALGMLIARQIARPVLALREGARAVGEGRLGHTIDAPADGELLELMQAFNEMSGRLERNRQEIGAKNQEIEAWNRELQARVDARTRELEEAQERLVRSARLAAAGEMGAGLAHELNNPLAGILGLTQVLLARAEGGSRAMLRSIEEQAIRCKEIVAQLLRFTQADASASDLDRGHRAVVDLDEVLVEVLSLVGGAFRERGVAVEHERGGPLPVRGDRAELASALTQLLASLRAASGKGGLLRITGARGATELELRFELHPGEVRVGRDEWMASGLGFWAAQQTLAAHGGQLFTPPLDPQKSLGGSLCWRVRLPGA